MALKIFVICAVFIIKVTSAADPWTTTANLSRLLTDHFGDNRHHVTNPDGKAAAFHFIKDTFTSYGLQVIDGDFNTDNLNLKGINVAGMWPGRLTGTRLDRPIVLTAHYDSSRGKAAVQDNGSGLAALMEAARLITSQPCIQDYLVVFAAFDFEIKENPADHTNAACYNGYCGSKDFVQQYMLRYLDSVGVHVANIDGVIILDSILNFNGTLGAQTLPPDFEEVPGLKESAESIKQDAFKGNFILVTSREEYDFPLYSAFYNRWDQAGQPQYKRQSVLLPLKDVVTAVETQSDPNWNVYREFISDDLTSFWNASTDIKAMLLTDTLTMRGRGRRNQGVDDKMVLTKERLEFLKKITDVVTRTVMDLAKFKDTCKDPMTEAPAAFRKGLQMSGTINMPQGGQDVTVTLDEFTSSGRMEITVVIVASGGTYKYAGHFNADDNRVSLWDPNPEWDVVSCFFSGHLHEVNSGVLFTGEMNGKCGDDWPHDVLTIVASDSGGSCGLTPSSSTDNLRSLLTNHFNGNRHHVTNPTGKQAAADYIHTTLKSYGMQIYVDKFHTENAGYKGRNIVGIWRGINSEGTGDNSADKPVILGAHYDTCRDNPGVDDNGSGLAALLEAARVISTQPCVPTHSVVFVAFDLQCGESPDHENTACSKGQCGSKFFVEETLVPYLASLDIKSSDIQGVIIMDSILNYNNTKNSQTAPPGFENTPLWEDVYVAEEEDGVRGNFIAIFSRQGYDQPLYSIFHNRWDEECNPQYKRRDVLIPYKNIADETDTASNPYWPVYQEASMDLASFWKASGDIKGLLLSDTEQHRGRDVGRHEKLPLTDDRLGFLKKITNVVTRTAMDLAGERRCNAQPDTIPEGFIEGIKLDGKVSLPGGDKDYSFVVNTFTTSGRVDATLSNSTWSIDVSGHFIPKQQVLLLRLLEPEWESLSCVMSGPLVNSGSGVLYSGAIHGSCSGAWPEGHVGFTLNSGKQTVGGGVGNGSLVVIGIVVGVALSLVVGAAVWYLRKRRPRQDGPTFQPLTEAT
ncbi:uncharacterized protein LOC144873005 [Branchiostoma floridae x Branchiostoma japonicum]